MDITMSSNQPPFLFVSRLTVQRESLSVIMQICTLYHTERSVDIVFVQGSTTHNKLLYWVIHILCISLGFRLLEICFLFYRLTYYYYRGSRVQNRWYLLLTNRKNSLNYLSTAKSITPCRNTKKMMTRVLLYNLFYAHTIIYSYIDLIVSTDPTRGTILEIN